MSLSIIFAQRPRTDPVKIAARIHRDAGAKPQQAIVRAVADEMRARMGLPPAEWPNISGWYR